jgi:hypothetical protein
MMTEKETRPRTRVFTPFEARMLLAMLVILIAAVAILITIRHRNLHRIRLDNLSPNHS